MLLAFDVAKGVNAAAADSSTVNFGQAFLAVSDPQKMAGAMKSMSMKTKLDPVLLPVQLDNSFRKSHSGDPPLKTKQWMAQLCRSLGQSDYMFSDDGGRA